MKTVSVWLSGCVAGVVIGTLLAAIGFGLVIAQQDVQVRSERHSGEVPTSSPIAY